MSKCNRDCWKSHALGQFILTELQKIEEQSLLHTDIKSFAQSLYRDSYMRGSRKFRQVGGGGS